MILSNSDILQALKDKRIIIDPPPPGSHLSPSSLDLRVGREFKTWIPAANGVIINFRLSDLEIPAYGMYTEDVIQDADGRIAIAPGAFVLAKTLERVELPLDSQLAARVEGRSSCARLGLAVHMTAPTIHAGFKGTITLEMKNFGEHTLLIDPGKTCICQIIFEQLLSKPKGGLDSDFQGQSSVLGN